MRKLGRDMSEVRDFRYKVFAKEDWSPWDEPIVDA